MISRAQFGLSDSRTFALSVIGHCALLVLGEIGHCGVSGPGIHDLRRVDIVASIPGRWKIRERCRTYKAVQNVTFSIDKPHD